MKDNEPCMVHIIMSKKYVHEFQVHMNNFIPFIL